MKINMKKLNKDIKDNNNNLALGLLLYACISYNNPSILNTSEAKSVLKKFSSIYVLKKYNKLLAQKKEAEKGQKHINNLIFGTSKPQHKVNKKYNNRNVSKQVVAR